MYRFTLPRDLYHGKDALSSLKNLSGKKAVVVVGGGSMKRFGFLDKAVDYLKEAGMEVKLIEGVEPDPSVETVMKGAAVMREFEPDWIVAMGGVQLCVFLGRKRFQPCGKKVQLVHIGCQHHVVGDGKTLFFLGKIAGNEKALRIIGRNADLPQGRLYLFGCGRQVQPDAISALLLSILQLDGK